jgi:hypothetical protein
MKLTKQSYNWLAGLSWLVLICTVFPLTSTGQTSLSIETAVRIEFPTVSTNAYMLEQSSDLTEWDRSWTSWVAGYGHPVVRFYEITDQRLFYRVQSTPRPAVVASSIPENGDMNVDPTVTDLIVSVTSDVQTNLYNIPSARSDWQIGEFPLSPGPGSWSSSQTYTAGVSLKTNTMYYAELVFRTTEGIPTLPFVLSFKTR